MGHKLMFKKNSRDGLNAYLLHLIEGLMHKVYGTRKRSIFHRLPTKIVEIGPGIGANLRYYAPGTSIIAIEPSIKMNPYLRASAARKNIEIDIKNIRGEELDLPTSSVNAVVGTLVLCSVDDPIQVVAEVHRILKPGGRYIFLEHIAAPFGSRLRNLQDVINKPWNWLFEGCNLNRNTPAILQNAGFASVEMDCFMLRSPLIPVTPHIFGLAIK